MVEVDEVASIKRQIRKLNKRIEKLREGESQLMGIVYGGDASHSQTLRELRSNIHNLENTIGRLNDWLQRFR
jgi:predicted  nucleic acid-binding Zn-ribbon protein